MCMYQGQESYGRVQLPQADKQLHNMICMCAYIIRSKLQPLSQHFGLMQAW